MVLLVHAGRHRCCGVIYSLLLAVAAINFKADQTLVGTAMNLLGTAAATVFVKAMNTAARPWTTCPPPSSTSAPKNAFLVNIGGFEFNWFMLLAAHRPDAVPMSCCTRPASACACAPAASIPRRRTPWASTSTRCATPACMISGVLGGLGGIVLHHRRRQRVEV